MVRAILYTVFCALLIAGAAGCSGFDKTSVLVHPTAATTADTIDVALVNLYTYISSGSTVLSTVNRDSLHLLTGLPATWEVLSAGMYIASDLKAIELLALQSTGSIVSVAADSLAAYAAHMVPLPSNNNWVAAIKSRTIPAHDKSNAATISVDAGKVANWQGFAAPLDLTLAQSSPVDTMLPIDSVLAMVEQTGMASASVVASAKQQLSLLPGFDSVGVIMVPIVLFLKVKTAVVAGTDTLYYYTKTASIPAEKVDTLQGLVPDPDRGDMVYVPVTLGSTKVVQQPAKVVVSSGLSIAIDRKTHTVQIAVSGAVKPHSGTISIYSLQGSLVKTLALSTRGTALWDGTDTQNHALRSGGYLVTCAGCTPMRITLTR